MTIIPQFCARRRVASALVAAALIAGLTGCGDAAVEDAAQPVAKASPLAVARLDAENHVAAAKQDAAAGDYKGAVEEYTVALNQLRPVDERLQDDSPDADILFQRGLAWLELGFPDTAAEDFSEVLRNQRGNGVAYAKRGQAYVALGDFYRAVRDCTDAIRFDPNCSSAYRYRGLAYLGRGQFERATIDMEQAIALDPAIEGQLAPLLGKAYYGWSVRLASAGDDGNASVKLTKARELNPTYAAEAIAADAVGVAAPLAESSSPAVPSTRVVAKPVIEEAVEHFRRGCDLQLEKQYDEAIIEFTEAIALDRKYADAYVRRAETLIAAGFPDSALKDLSAALRIDERSADAHRLQAEAFMSLGSYHRVAMSATEALQVDPSDARMYALRGKAYLQMGERDRAIADLDEAVKRAPELEPELQPLLDEALTTEE